jgi:hypothetical protein
LDPLHVVAANGPVAGECTHHLSDAPVRQAFTEGNWCTDFIFEYDGPGPRFADENRWMLPRRWRMAGAFKASLVGEPPQAAPPSATQSRDGNLAIFVSGDHPGETIKVPTAYEAMQHALAADGASATDWHLFGSFKAFVRNRFEFSRFKCRALKDPYVG